MTKSLLTGVAVCAALAIFAGNANAFVRKAHAHAYAHARAHVSSEAQASAAVRTGGAAFNQHFSEDCVPPQCSGGH